jgi:hypothetical protein
MFNSGFRSVLKSNQSINTKGGGGPNAASQALMADGSMQQ